MSSAIVSIIIPSFNREALTLETLDSVRAQTSSDWEAIVVDDGSTDEAFNAIKNYVAQDERIQLVKRSRSPKGASVCRNIGIEHSQGQYIMFLDSDDLLAPFCVEGRVTYMQEHPQLDFAVFQMSYFNEKGVVKNLEQLKRRDNYLYAYLRHDLPWNINCPIWKASFFKNKLKGYNECYPRLQDPELNARALMVNDVKFEVLFDSEPDSYCRLHTNKLFNFSTLFEGFQLFIKEFSGRIKNRPDYKACKEELRQGYIEAVRSFYSYYKPEWHNESIRILADINKFAYKDGLITAKTHLLTNLLIRAYKMRMPAVLGGKYVLKSIMKLIKIS